ncbi:MAG: ribosomal protection-like ABC-F family protein [Christensenellales bacterium]|jgi:lincosamide and streptogramin A transport system ATP-binding/permease protein
MSMIRVQDLSFTYPSGFEPVFSRVSFSLDTDWRTGLISRNGRGKTTFLRLLMGKMPYQGTITAAVDFSYFPFPVEEPERPAEIVLRELIAPYGRWEAEMEKAAALGEAGMDAYAAAFAAYIDHDGYAIDETIVRETALLGVREGVLSRPFATLSPGERTKCLLAALFCKHHAFLLIDEPTNHLDLEGRRQVGDYLAGKKGFILVSHDRDFLDRSVDHVLSINRANIEVQQGNFSSWEENRRRQDAFELAENEKLAAEISRLRKAAERTAGWADKAEKSKIGFDPRKTEKTTGRRVFEGAKSKKLMSSAKAVEKRRKAALEEKGKLLKNLERSDALKLRLLPPPKPVFFRAAELSLWYEPGKPLFLPVSFTLEPGEQVAVTGPNGCGKTTLLKAVLGETSGYSGVLERCGGLTVSYVPQSTDHLRGDLTEYARQEGLDITLFLTILRKLDFSRAQFEKDMGEYSGGQKKKVLIAAALSRPAHLLVWDEPLNYVDVLSRMQIEELLTIYRPSLLMVEHDARFLDNVAGKRIALEKA